MDQNPVDGHMIAVCVPYCTLSQLNSKYYLPFLLWYLYDFPRGPTYPSKDDTGEYSCNIWFLTFIITKTNSLIITVQFVSYIQNDIECVKIYFIYKFIYLNKDWLLVNRVSLFFRIMICEVLINYRLYITKRVWIHSRIHVYRWKKDQGYVGAWTTRS